MAPCKFLRTLPDRHVVSFIMELVRNRSFTLTTGNGVHSWLRRLKNGFLQKLVLAPLLFNIYTHDLPVTVARKLVYETTWPSCTLRKTDSRWRKLSQRTWQPYHRTYRNGSSSSVPHRCFPPVQQEGNS